VTIVDSAATTAEALERDLRTRDLAATRASGRPISLLATDSPERFARVGSRFLGETFEPHQVELVDLIS
jgi:glutamate racemase